MRGEGVKTMRLFEKQKQTKTPMQVFNKMMEGISEIIEFYDGQINSKNNTSEETVYNYVMRNENGLVKIGISHDVEFRKRTLENAGGYFIPDVYKTISKQKASNVESMLHDYFSIDRKLGEWFKIDYFDAINKTKEFSMLDNNENYNEESKNKKIDRLMFFSSLAGCDEDVPDYLIISSTLRQDNPNATKNLIDIYVCKYVTEGGLETYNLFSLYLLLYLREKYNINKIILKNGLFCSICGYTVYLEDPKIDFCECADWYLAVYEQTHEF